MRTERQGHGFIFEDYIINKYNITSFQNDYTSKWDGEFNGYPVSIKHIKKGNAIDLADLFRQASITEDFFMFVGFYTENGDDEIHILYVPGEEWHSYFMDLSEFEQKFKEALNSVTNDRVDDQKWNTLRQDCVNFWKTHTNSLITVNGKRDHSHQKRWQCSINKTNFYKEFLPKYEISEEELLTYAKRNKE